MTNTKSHTLVLLLILLAGIIGVSSVISSTINYVTIRNSGTIATYLPLHVEGRYIKNALGETVVLRGINKAGFEDDPSGWWNPEGGGYTAGSGYWNPDAVVANLDAMKNWGMNVIRSHQPIRYWLDNDDTTWDGRNVGITYREAIKEVIRMCGERGIYYIFEPYSVRGYGEPANGQDPMPFPPYSIEYQQGLDPLVIPNEDVFVEYWRSVAEELKNYPNVIFEIYNEPTRIVAFDNAQAKSDWQRVHQKSIDAIRSTGATQLIIVQWQVSIWTNLDYPPPNNPAQTMDWVEEYPLNDSLNNIVYSFHNYRSDFHRSDSVPPEDRNSWEYDDIDEALRICLVDYVLNNLSKPVFCGEIGPNMWTSGLELERELAYLNNSLAAFNNRGISFTVYVWTIPAHMRFGVLQTTTWIPPPNEGGQVLIDALANPD